MKAFLSHSSKDKEFVRAVADELGRQYCVIDERSFDTGITFKQSIEKGLNESSVFVLFASKAALESLWVEFEINEAWYRILEKKIRESLVFIIESSVEPADLPVWLQRAKISKVNAPKPTSRTIREHVDFILRHETHSYFVGRNDDVQRLQQALTPSDGSPPPKHIVITGLPGIGRRSIIRHIAPFTLNLNRIIAIRLEEGDDLTDFALKLADQIEPFSTAEGFLKIAEEIKASTDVENIERIVADLQLCIANKELPVIFDDGGLLDGDGRLQSAAKSILSALPLNSQTYLFMVSTRKPNVDGGEPITVVQLNPLKPEDTKSLIATLARRKGLQLKSGQISELSEYVGGFPPACGYAVQLSIDYGIDAVIQNKNRLVEFRTLPFVKYLTEKKLSDGEAEILRILAEYSPLPLSVIGHVTGITSELLSERIIKLIDYSLISPQREGFYAISDPIKDAVVRLTRLVISTAEHAAVADNLKIFIDSNEIEEHAIDAYRILFRAARNSNQVTLASQALHLANDVIQLVERSYHARAYDEAIKLAREALVMRPNNINAHSFLIRALIQEALWSDAEEALSRFEVVAPQRDSFFLKGFFKRKKGDFKAAIQLFHQSEKAGRRGSALKRELAWCYAMEGKWDEAETYLKDALKTHSDNPFIVDLGVQIATRQKNEVAARQRLEQLKDIESSAFYQHRLSYVEARFGNASKAREAAEQAVILEEKPTFEMIGQLAVCEYRMGNLDVADKQILRLERDYPRKRPDFRLTLRALIEKERKHYSNSLEILDRLSSKCDAFYYQLRKDAIEGELKTSALNDSKRIEYQKEIQGLDMLLSKVPKAALYDLIEH